MRMPAAAVPTNNNSRVLTVIERISGSEPSSGRFVVLPVAAIIERLRLPLWDVGLISAMQQPSTVN